MLICPSLFGYISSYALSEKNALLTIAYLDEDKSSETEILINELSGITGMTLIEISDSREGQRLIKSRKVEGVLTIREGFSANIYSTNQKDTKYMLSYKAAPGTRSANLAAENISLSIIRVRSKNMLYNAVSGLDMSAAENCGEIYASYISGEPVVSVDYIGGAFDPMNTLTPQHGAAALVIMTAALFAALKTGGAKNVRARLYGKIGITKDFFANITGIFIIWSASVSVYMLFTAIAYRKTPAITEAAALIAFILMCLGLGSFFASFFPGEKNSVYAFIPFFLINITAGGALWGNTANNTVIKIFIPSAAFLTAAEGKIFYLIYMTSVGIILLGASLIRKTTKPV